MTSNSPESFLGQFSKTWAGGYFEGDPRDPMAESTYQVYGYNSVLFTVYQACIRPYVNEETSVLEIGPGRGAWSRAILERGCRKLYAVDAAPAEHTHFWEYVGRDSRVTYLVAKDCELGDVPDRSIDFLFSFGVFCHLTPEMCESYIRALAKKMKPGANGFLQYADFDKYNQCLDNADRVSLKRFFDQQWRKVWQPARLGYRITWNLFRPRVDLPRLSKQSAANLIDASGLGSWHHWGTACACAVMERHGFKVIDRDIGALHRDPITHFRQAN